MSKFTSEFLNLFPSTKSRYNDIKCLVEYRRKFWSKAQKDLNFKESQLAGISANLIAKYLGVKKGWICKIIKGKKCHSFFSEVSNRPDKIDNVGIIMKLRKILKKIIH